MRVAGAGPNGSPETGDEDWDMTDAPRQAEQGIQPAVIRARSRLAQVEGRSLLQRYGLWAAGFGGLCAASRPLVWPLHDVPLWVGLGRAVVLGLVGSAIASVALVIAGRRRRPSELGAARAIDEAMGLSEVVASGFAFERDGRADAGASLARRRAVESAQGIDVVARFPLPSLKPARRTLGRVSIGLAGALLIGAYDHVLAGALITPPTDDERRAASALEQAASELGESAHPPPDPKKVEAPKREHEKGERNSPAGEKLAEKAREAARAARRGDRQGALAKLDELRSAGRSQAARAAELKAALKQVAEALDPPKGGGRKAAARAADPSAKAADSMRLLAKKMREPESPENAAEKKESEERTLERLERAGEEAKKAAGQGEKNGESQQSANAAAEALSKAAEALSRGDREAAAKMLEEAAARAESMEKSRAEAAAEATMIAEMLEKSGALERAIEMAMLGKDGQGQEGQGMAMGEGEGDGQGDKDGDGKPGGGKPESGLRRALAARLAALGMDGAPGTGTDGGGSIPDRKKSHREGLEAKGSVRAPSEVGEGERAIQAIQGLGKGSDPPASYREVFPSYDAAVEEGLADERIPAARRTAVRKYFESIRPGQR